MASIEWSGGINAFYRKRIATAALNAAAKACEVEREQVTAAGRSNANAALARQVAMYLCHVVGAMSLRDVATEFQRDPTTVSHACHAIENRRECPIFDVQIERLERGLRAEIAGMFEAVKRKGSAPEKKSMRLVG